MQGGHTSLKVGERIGISGVSPPVIHAIVSINFVRSASWEVMLCIIWPMLFLLIKISYSTKPTVIWVLLHDTNLMSYNLYCDVIFSLMRIICYISIYIVRKTIAGR